MYVAAANMSSLRELDLRAAKKQVCKITPEMVRCWPRARLAVVPIVIALLSLILLLMYFTCIHTCIHRYYYVLTYTYIEYIAQCIYTVHTYALPCIVRYTNICITLSCACRRIWGIVCVPRWPRWRSTCARSAAAWWRRLPSPPRRKGASRSTRTFIHTYIQYGMYVYVVNSMAGLGSLATARCPVSLWKESRYCMYVYLPYLFTYRPPVSLCRPALSSYCTYIRIIFHTYCVVIVTTLLNQMLPNFFLGLFMNRLGNDILEVYCPSTLIKEEGYI